MVAGFPINTQGQNSYFESEFLVVLSRPVKRHEAFRMKLLQLFSITTLLAMPLPVRSDGADDKKKENKLIHVFVETEKGDIVLALEVEKAPKTVANFLRYVSAKYYKGGRFHRTVKADNQPESKVKIEVVQAGINPDKFNKEFPPIKLERTRDTKILHKEGTISMARDGPDTATSDFFICIKDQPELDFGGKRNPDGQGFAAFGKVIKGMDVVKKIHAADAEGQDLKPPIKIVDIEQLAMNFRAAPARARLRSMPFALNLR